MADTGKQSPLGINVIGSYLSNQGLNINPVAASYMGASKTNSDYTFGRLVSDTCLRMLTWAINDAYLRNEVDQSVYDNLLTIGSASVPALGNSKPPTYVVVDPSNIWTDTAVQYGEQQGVVPSLPGPATSGYSIISDTDQGQQATWLPYDNTNPNSSITQWGYIRLHALQAWNEFNYNGTEVELTTPEYKEFLSSFMSALSFIEYNNQAIMANQNAKTFLDGAYSNMDDLISADVYGINLANNLFGTDLENLGKVINLSRIDSFGLPSVLLQTIGENNAVVQDLVLALLSSGLESDEVQGLISGEITTPTPEQEQKIYSAFLIIIGENLQDVLAPLQCFTMGLTSLADLLDVRKLFPNSYQSLTVPKYNGQLGLPTNSKTYYPLYVSGGLNDALTTESMNDYVGAQTPKRPPNITRNRRLNSTNINKPKKGFGTYLENILPKQQAVAAGAFSFTMRQVKNIDRADIKKFARVVKSLENTRNLDLVNGTSKPTNQTAIDNLQEKEALGSGPYGTYTMSDFFGCMSGLPYPWQKIYGLLKSLENSTLYETYKQLFLAVTWEQATATVQSVESPAGVWTVTGITITNPGGGYGRENDPAPTVTINGVTVTATIGTDDMNVGSNGNGTFGRITNISIPTTTFNSVPVITIAPPPGPGFPGMDSVIQDYIDQANDEIENLATGNSQRIQLLNTYWNILGSQLAIEQRARYIALPPVTVPKDLFSNPYAMTINVFVDSIPNISQDTRPHMSAQTLEAISDMSSLGGQSAMAHMRQERNQRRLITAGIPLDNNISTGLSNMDKKTLTTNNTIPAGINNAIESPTINLINSQPEIYGNVTNGVLGFTNPSWNVNEINGQDIVSVPNGVYIPSDTNLIGEYIPAVTFAEGDITPILEGNPVPVVNTIVPAATTSLASLTSLAPQTTGDIVIIAPPEQLATNVPIELDTNYTGTTLLPATYSIQEAIDKVVECNCDCWLD
jgi:hypothetical protein